MSSKNGIIEFITPPLSEIYGNPKKAKKYGLKIGKPIEMKQEIVNVKTCFVSDSDGCIYQEGTREEWRITYRKKRKAECLIFYRH